MNRATHTRMEAKHILILGGYGSTGLPIACEFPIFRLLGLADQPGNGLGIG